MRYDDIIQTEDTDFLYDRWQDYRDELTDFIIQSVEHYHIRRHLNFCGTLRLRGTYNIEDIVRGYKEKPVLAIWGAGGCNDIDIVRLSGYFRLVLIARDIVKLKKTIERFGLDGTSCVCTDLYFWDISPEEYRLFEAMLMDGCSKKEIGQYLRDIAGHMEIPDYDSLPDFDYSVVVGLASQLNVRLAALADLYGHYNNVKDILHELNVLAVDRLLCAVEKMTDKMVITGYELIHARDSITQEDEDIRCKLNEDEEIPVFSRICSMRDEGNHSAPAGNEVLEDTLRLWTESERYRIISHKAMFWPFYEHKSYLMMLFAMEKSQGSCD